MAENVYYVYIHRRNDNNEVFYVGKGKKNRATSKSGRNSWWNNIVNKVGYSVEFIEKGLSEDDAFDLEIETIKFYRECGNALCNMTSGGEGMSGMRHTDTAKKKMSDARKGSHFTEEHKQNLSESHKRIITDERREVLSKNRKGRLHSEETKAKYSETRKGVEIPQETRIKMVESTKRNAASKREKGILLKSDKPVQCSNGMIFPNSEIAAVWLRSQGRTKAVRGLINRCCLGDAMTAYGFTWIRLNIDINEDTPLPLYIP